MWSAAFRYKSHIQFEPDSVIFAAAAKRSVKRHKGHSSKDVERFAAFWAKAKYGKIGVFVVD